MATMEWVELADCDTIPCILIIYLVISVASYRHPKAVNWEGILSRRYASPYGCSQDSPITVASLASEQKQCLAFEQGQSIVLEQRQCQCLVF